MDLKQKRIAIVHKDQSAGLSLLRLARAAEMIGVQFGSIGDFLVSFEIERFDVVVMDWSLVGESTFDSLLAAKEHEALPFPIVVVSQKDDQETRQQASELGAVGFFREPVDGEALLDAIRWALRQAASAESPDQRSAKGPHWRADTDSKSRQHSERHQEQGD